MAVYRSIVEFHLDPEKLDEAVPALRAVLAQTRAWPGCEEIDIVQNDNDPGHHTAVVAWQSGQAQAEYSDWRAAEQTPEILALREYVVAPNNKYFGSVV